MDQYNIIKRQDRNAMTVRRGADGKNPALYLHLERSTAKRYSWLEIVSDMHSMGQKGLMDAQEHQLAQLLIVMTDTHNWVEGGRLFDSATIAVCGSRCVQSTDRTSFTWATSRLTPGWLSSRNMLCRKLEWRQCSLLPTHIKSQKGIRAALIRQEDYISLLDSYGLLKLTRCLRPCCSRLFWRRVLFGEGQRRNLWCFIRLTAIWHCRPGLTRLAIILRVDALFLYVTSIRSIATFALSRRYVILLGFIHICNRSVSERLGIYDHKI